MAFKGAFGYHAARRAHRSFRAWRRIFFQKVIFYLE